MRKIIALLIIFTLLGCNAAMAAGNVVAAYLKNSDHQYESDQQREDIIEALQDMLNQPINIIRNKRYKDYEGKPGSWSLPDMVRRYFVPTSSVTSFSDDEFFKDLRKPPAPKVIHAQLLSIQKEAQK